MGHPLGLAMSVAVVIIASSLSVLALAAWRRNRDARMLYLWGAFALFAMLGALSPIEHWTGWFGHNSTELWHAVLELAIIGLLVAPFLHKS